jgi:HEAT repeat protein
VSRHFVCVALAMGLVLGVPRPGSAADPKKPAAVQKPSLEEQKAAIRAGLKSGDVEVRRAAIKSLTHNHAATELLPELQAALVDADGEVRARAATVTGSMNSTETVVVPQLIQQLEHDTFKEARETAARALGRIGQAVPTERRGIAALEKAAKTDPDSVTRVVSLSALAMMEQDAAQRIVAIDIYLSDADPLTRMKAAHSLGMLGEKAKSSAPAIAAALQKADDKYQRGYLARALGQVGDPGQLPALYVEHERETDPTASLQMSTAIKRLGGKVPTKK